MRFYEAALVLRPELDEEQVSALLTQLTDVVKQEGGEAGEAVKWGRRRLAYEIDGHRDGVYVFQPFQADPKATEEIHRILKLNEDVVRFMVFNLEEEAG